MRQRVDLHWRINLMTFFYICGTTSSNRACAWRHGECTGLLCCGKYQCKFMVAPRSSPIAASVTTKIKHVARFVRQWMQCAGRGAEISSGKVIIHPAQPGVLCLLGWVEKRESQETKNPWLVRMDDDLTARNICSPASTLHSLESGNWRLDTGLLKEGRYEFWWVQSSPPSSKTQCLKKRKPALTRSTWGRPLSSLNAPKLHVYHAGDA